MPDRLRLVDELAERAHAVAGAPLPGPVESAAKAHVADTVAALVAGHATLAAGVAGLGGGAGPALRAPDGPEAGGLAPLDPDAARRTAYAAGVYVHCWEAGGIHRGAVTVPGCAVLPATLAVLAARPDLTWDEYLRAYTAGYEVALGAALAVRADQLLQRGWWPTAMVAPLGGAAAASLLLGHPVHVTASAIALAAQQAGGTVAGDSVGADGRYLLGGLTAERAVGAALAAGAGWRGPRDVLDDPRSPLRRHDDTPLPTGEFLLTQTSIKPHTCAKHLQAAVDAVLDLRRETRQWAGRSPLAIDCELPANLVPVVDRPPPFGSPLAALASAQFVLALAALRGRCVPGDFAPTDPASHEGLAVHQGGGLLDDPALVELAGRVRVVPAADLTAAFPANWGARVAVTTAPGQPVLRAQHRQTRGDPGLELSEAELTAKFTALAGPSLGDAAAYDLAGSLLTASPGAPVTPLSRRVLPLLRARSRATQEA